MQGMHVGAAALRSIGVQATRVGDRSAPTEAGKALLRAGHADTLAGSKRASAPSWVLAVATTPVELIASAAWSAFIAFELFKLALPSFEHLTNSPPLPTL
jgi:hypothetical protein